MSRTLPRSGGERRARDTLHATDDERARSEAGTRGTSGEEALGAAFLHRAATHDNRRVLLAAHGIRWMLCHLDDFGCRLRFAALHLLRERLDDISRSAEDDREIGIAGKRRLHAFEDDFRGVVAAHRIDSYRHLLAHGGSFRWAGVS